ncbi:MAG: sulfatase [Bacteroidota bacterium]|nr:arylsulfatase [Odoribacter sp.]MDP3642204.1 sulfatase [Bacteroidota bacterium]
MNQIVKHSLLTGLAILPISTFCESTEKPQNPNIILIFMDDLGYGDLSCYGATQYKTPNLDKMASQGVRFTSFLSAQAVCSASRAGIMTGCYPNRIGISGALMPDAKIGLNPSEETIAEILKKSNYKTAAIGKWHLGYQREFLPLQQGFDEYLGLPYSNDMWPVDYDGKPATENSNKARYPALPLIDGNEKIREIKTLDDQSELTTLYTERAVRFIGSNKKNPFFLYLAHSMPHVPLAVSAKFKGKSQQGMYGDVMMEIDWSVGEIMKALEQNGLEKNTLVIFTSDNGPWLNFGNHAGSTGGLREGKGTSFEGGQRVPCLMKWPGHIQEGTICNKLASTIDILPTLAAITYSPLPEKKIDGVNILPLLLGDENANPRESFLYYYRKNSLEAIRKGDWKLVFAHPGRTYIGYKPGFDGFPGGTNENYPHEEGLYDLRRDPGERYDVKEYYPEVVAELKKLSDEAREDLGDDIQKIEGKNRREPGKVL